MRFEAVGLTDTGRERESNQDHWGMDVVPVPGAEYGAVVGIFAIADGVGGRSHGEVASAMFCDEVLRHVSQVAEFTHYTAARDRQLRKSLLQLLQRAASRVGSRIYASAEADDELSGMSTTGIVLVTVDNGAFIAHVGDSRAYLVRGDRIYRLTEDHTVATQLMKEGMIQPEEVDEHVFAHVLTRAFGASPTVDVDTLFVRTSPGDRFVLCTDGLHGHLRGADIHRFARRFEEGPHLAARLIEEANARGGEDNITCVVIDAVGTAEPTTRLDAVELDARIAMMRQLFLFQDLNEQEVMRVLRIAHHRDVAAGELIIRDGAVGHDFYVVLEGTARVTKGGEALTTIGPGGHFGELALIDDVRRSADVEALTPMTVLTIERADLLSMLDDDLRVGHKLLKSFLRNMSGRVRDLSERIYGDGG